MVAIFEAFFLLLIIEDLSFFNVFLWYLIIGNLYCKKVCKFNVTKSMKFTKLVQS